MSFTEALCFYLSHAPLDTGAKMPPAGCKTAHKRWGDGVEYRGT